MRFLVTGVALLAFVLKATSRRHPDRNAHCLYLVDLGRISPMARTTTRASKPKRPGVSRGKEVVLLFLSGFYFLVATNTQSGWLFLLSAFLLGLLAICWLPPRRAARSASLERELVGSPQRGVATRVRLQLSNRGSKPLREVLVVEPANPWSQENADFRWVVPWLAAGESVSTEYTVTPEHRGEHTLAGSVVRFGAPFGLFAQEVTHPDSAPFLVYPRLLTLPSQRQLTRLAGILTEFTSPRSKGDSRSLRSLREYQPGDDLRLVHWASSAKSSRGALLVREHHAPSRQLSLLLLDTSSREHDPDGSNGFENSVMLAASLLWSGHRSGTRCALLVLEQGSWRRMTRWEEQYASLARVSLDPTCNFLDWLQKAQGGLRGLPEARMGAQPIVISSASTPSTLGEPEEWPAAAPTCLLVTPTEQACAWSRYPVHLVDLEALVEAKEVHLHV